MSLKTDYKDDILDQSANTKRKYETTTNSDGTVSFTDRTVYEQSGDTFGSADANAITTEVNSLSTKVSKAIEIVSFNSSTGELVTRTMQ